METLRRREKYVMNVELDLGPEHIAAVGRRQNVRLHIINLRNRRLTIENLDALSVSMPKLQRRLTGEPDPPAPIMANIKTDCLTSPFTYKYEDEENARCCRLVARPARVMMTPAGFRPPAGRLLSPVHPNKAHIAVLKADQGNDILPLEWEGLPYNRVVSTVYSAAGEEMNGWFRVSDYYEDGHMILSVLCYFPIVEEERVEQEEPQKKRKREDESSTDLPERKRLRL